MYPQDHRGYKTEIGRQKTKTISSHYLFSTNVFSDRQGPHSIINYYW